MDVIRQQPDHFVVEVLTSNNNADLLIRQAITFHPNAVVIVDVSKLDYVRQELSAYPVKVYGGEQALAEIVEMDSIDLFSE